ncbi:GNAT family N-acetyltransferase [Alkaliphilus serpentinus]|nr:GNAT family N-acetyltransferase [Alkaliphilus serpentinus]
MIEIRKLTEDDMQQAMELKVLCWTEELAGRAENTLSVSKERDSWLDWMNTAEEHNDIRLLIGAFENNQMLGVAFASFAETDDIPDKGIELNGFWVYPNQRGKGISLMLLLYVLDFYSKEDMEKIVIYNPHYAPSNQYYQKLGAKVVKQEYQMEGKLLVDVFIADIVPMKMKLKELLHKYQ